MSEAVLTSVRRSMGRWCQPGVLAALLVLTLGADVVQAQSQPATSERSFYGGFGIGWGSMECDQCLWTAFGGERKSGTLGSLKLVWIRSPRLHLAIELDAWFTHHSDAFGTSGADVQIFHGAAYVAAKLYPTRATGIFVQGGAGPSILHQGETPSRPSSNNDGISFIVGAGYDIPVGGFGALTPHLDYIYFADGNGLNNGTLIQVALDLTLHRRAS